MSPVATPADSAGGSNAATADDGHATAAAANPTAANPAGPAGPQAGAQGAAPAHPAGPSPPAPASNPAFPPPFTSNPAHADGQGGWMNPGANAASQGAAPPHPLTAPQPAHSMQNSVFMASRWDRATGSTSTVRAAHSAGEGGSMEKEDSAGDSNTAAVSEGNTQTGPADSTQAQHVKSGGGSPSRSVGGEEVEGGVGWEGAYGLAGEAVDSHPVTGTNAFRSGGIGDGFAEGVGTGAFGAGFDMDAGQGHGGSMSFSLGASGGQKRGSRAGRGGKRAPGGGGGGRSSSGIIGGADPRDPLSGANNPFGAVQGSTPGFTHAAPKPAGSALKGGLPPVPLFNATNPPGIDSPVPPGTAAAARAAQTQEAEGECDGLNPGLGGMEIGTGGGYVVPTHSEEHGYAPALASGDMTYSGDGGYVSGGGNSGPGSIGGGGGSGPNLSGGNTGHGGSVGGNAVAGGLGIQTPGNMDATWNVPNASGGWVGGNGPNVPAVAAVSGAGVVGHDGVQSMDPFGNQGAPDSQNDGQLAKSQFSNGVAQGGFVYQDATGGNQTLQTQHRAISGSAGHVSMHKNGPSTISMQGAVVEDGGDDSEEDGEEGVSPAFVPEDGSPADME